MKNQMVEQDGEGVGCDDLKHLTVVFSYKNVNQFVDELERLKSRFINPSSSDNLPWLVTAMSTDNEIFRLELIEQALDRGRSEYIGEILAHSNIGSLTGLDDLIGASE